MNTIEKRTRREGAGLVGYTLVLALVALVGVASLTRMGIGNREVLAQAGATMQGVQVGDAEPEPPPELPPGCKLLPGAALGGDAWLWGLVLAGLVGRKRRRPRRPGEAAPARDA